MRETVLRSAELNGFAEGLKTATAFAAGALLASGILVISGMRVGYAAIFTLGLGVTLALMVARVKRRFCLAVVTLCLPLAGTNFFIGAPPATFHAGGAQSVPEINLVDLLVLPAILALVLLNRDAPRLPSTPTRLFLAFMGWSGLSILGSGHQVLGMVSLFDLAKVFLVWVYVATAVRSSEDCRVAANCLVAGLFGQGLVGVLQAFVDVPSWAHILTKGGDPTYLEALDDVVFRRVGGTIGWSTTFAQYLELLTPLALALFCCSERRRVRWLGALSASAGGAAMLLTLSRAGWGTLLFGSLLCLALVGRSGTAVVRKRIRIVIAVGLVGVLLALPLVLERLGASDQGSAANRLPMWSVALRMVAAHPLLGSGLNTYSEVMHGYDPEGVISHFEFPVHNVYLFVAAEVGLPGLVFVLLFLGWALRAFYRTSCEGAMVKKAVSAGLFAGLLSMLAVHAMVEPSFKQELALWYVMSAVCGLAVGVRRIESRG